MRVLALSVGCAAILGLGRPAAADPVVIDTVGLFDTQFRAYTTSERPPTWVPDLKVIVAVEDFAKEDVLVYQLKQGAKKIGPAHTCPAYTSLKAPAGALTHANKEMELVFFKCQPEEKHGVKKGGAYALELSYKSPLAGKEYKAFATLNANIIAAMQGRSDDPSSFFMEDMDDKLNISMVHESVVREYSEGEADRMLGMVVTRASKQGLAQDYITPVVTIRTWIKEGETTMPQTSMTCLLNGKKVAEDGDYSAVSRDYWTYVKKGKEARIIERWVQKRYLLEKLVFDPPCGFDKYKANGQSMDRFWLSKNPGEYRCVIMGGGEILKEIFFTIGPDGKIVRPACQAKVNTLRHITLVASKDHKIANVKFDKKAGKMGFSRVTWDPGCPPSK